MSVNPAEVTPIYDASLPIDPERLDALDQYVDELVSDVATNLDTSMEMVGYLHNQGNFGFADIREQLPELTDAQVKILVEAGDNLQKAMTLTAESHHQEPSIDVEKKKIEKFEKASSALNRFFRGDFTIPLPDLNKTLGFITASQDSIARHKKSSISLDPSKKDLEKSMQILEAIPSADSACLLLGIGVARLAVFFAQPDVQERMETAADGLIASVPPEALRSINPARQAMIVLRFLDASSERIDLTGRLIGALLPDEISEDEFETQTKQLFGEIGAYVSTFALFYSESQIARRVLAGVSEKSFGVVTGRVAELLGQSIAAGGDAEFRAITEGTPEAVFSAMTIEDWANRGMARLLNVLHEHRESSREVRYIYRGLREPGYKIRDFIANAAVVESQSVATDATPQPEIKKPETTQLSAAEGEAVQGAYQKSKKDIRKAEWARNTVDLLWREQSGPAGVEAVDQDEAWEYAGYLLTLHEVLNTQPASEVFKAFEADLQRFGDAEDVSLVRFGNWLTESFIDWLDYEPASEELKTVMQAYNDHIFGDQG